MYKYLKSMDLISLARRVIVFTFYLRIMVDLGFLGGSGVKNPPAMQEPQ